MRPQDDSAVRLARLRLAQRVEQEMRRQSRLRVVTELRPSGLSDWLRSNETRRAPR